MRWRTCHKKKRRRIFGEWFRTWNSRMMQIMKAEGAIRKRNVERYGKVWENDFFDLIIDARSSDWVMIALDLEREYLQRELRELDGGDLT